MAALVAAVLGALLAAASPAGAQPAGPELVTSTPEEGAVLRDSPDEVRLTFDRSVAAAGAVLQVVDPDGAVVTADAEAVGARALRFPLPLPLASGRHLLGWRVADQDGPWSGAFVVTVDPTGVGTTEVDRAVVDAPGRTAAWRAALVALIAVLAAAVVLTIEGVAGRRLRAAVVVGLLLGTGLATLVALGLAGVDADGSAADLVGADAWTGVATDPTGRRWLVALLVLVTAPAVLLADPAGPPGRMGRVLLAVLLVTGAGAAAESAHGAQAVGAGSPVSAEQAVADGRVEVTLEPGRPGVNEAHVYSFGAAGSAPDLTAGAVAFTHRATGIGPLEVATVPVAPGHLIAPVVDLPLAGEWEATVGAATRAGSPIRLILEVPA